MKVITKENFAPARKLVEARLKRVMRADIKIGDGPSADDYDGAKIPKGGKLCIMEATAYILGYEEINDAPPCTSPIIREFMIAINDGIGDDRKRAQLKKVIPEIVNTAPTVWKNGYRTVYDQALGYEVRKLVPVLQTKKGDLDFRAAEKTRREILNAYKRAWKTSAQKRERDAHPNGYHIAYIEWDNEIAFMKMNDVLSVIRELAAVAKFDAANEKAETLPTEAAS